LFGEALAATARCKNEGKDAMPSIAMPPPLRKYRRDIVMTAPSQNRAIQIYRR
jgi:hypothetical protein